MKTAEEVLKDHIVSPEGGWEPTDHDAVIEAMKEYAQQFIKGNNSVREYGYYWVKRQGEWIIAEWYFYDNPQTNCWIIPGLIRQFDDNYFEEIDEERLLREEK